MNPFDAGVVAVIVLSGIFAFARGFVKELLSIAAWLGATFATLYAFPYAQIYARKIVPSAAGADAVAAVVLFILALLILSATASVIAGRVRSSSLSAFDRTFGLIFGLLRGLLLVCLAYMVLAWLMPPEGVRPEWLATARTEPLLAQGAATLERLVPSHVRARATTAVHNHANVDREVERAIGAYSRPAPAPPPRPDDAPNYTPQEQHDLDHLFQQQQNDGSQ